MQAPQNTADRLFATMIAGGLTPSEAATELGLSARWARRVAQRERGLSGEGRLAGWAPARKPLDWGAVFAWMCDTSASRRAAALRFDVPGQTMRRHVDAELALPNRGRLAGWEPRRWIFNWDAIFAWMVATGKGQSAAAKQFSAPIGTILSATHHERAKPEGGRLKGWKGLETRRARRVRA